MENVSQPPGLVCPKDHVVDQVVPLGVRHAEDVVVQPAVGGGEDLPGPGSRGVRCGVHVPRLGAVVPVDAVQCFPAVPENDQGRRQRPVVLQTDAAQVAFPEGFGCVGRDERGQVQLVAVGGPRRGDHGIGERAGLHDDAAKGVLQRRQEVVGVVREKRIPGGERGVVAGRRNTGVLRVGEIDPLLLGHPPQHLAEHLEMGTVGSRTVHEHPHPYDEERNPAVGQEFCLTDPLGVPRLLSRVACSRDAVGIEVGKFPVMAACIEGGSSSAAAVGDRVFPVGDENDKLFPAGNGIVVYRSDVEIGSCRFDRPGHRGTVSRARGVSGFDCIPAGTIGIDVGGLVGLGASGLHRNRHQVNSVPGIGGPVDHQAESQSQGIFVPCRGDVLVEYVTGSAGRVRENVGSLRRVRVTGPRNRDRGIVCVQELVQDPVRHVETRIGCPVPVEVPDRRTSGVTGHRPRIVDDQKHVRSGLRLEDFGIVAPRRTGKETCGCHRDDQEENEA